MAEYGLTDNALKALTQRNKKRIEKAINSVTPEVVSGLRNWAHKYATKKGMGCIAEDFASYCVMRRVLGQSAHVKSAFVDFMRETYGDTRTEIGRHRSKGELNHTPLEHAIAEAKVSPKLFEILDGISWTSTERAIYLLKNYFGFLQSEIAFTFGVTKSEIHSILTEVQNRIEATVR